MRTHLIVLLALLPVVACQALGNIQEKKQDPGAPAEDAAPMEPPAAVDCEGGAGDCDAAAASTKRSCTGAAGAGRDCGGPTGTISCCESRPVVGGDFFRDYDGVKGAIIPHDQKDFPATVSSFSLDTFEVTVGRFRAFVAQGLGTQAKPPAPGAGAHPKIKGTGWDPLWSSRLVPDTVALSSALECGTLNKEPVPWTKTPSDQERLPMRCVSWYEAFAFCAWDGGRLPTNTELNYAQSGGAEQRLYPWGSDPAGTDHVSKCTGDCTAKQFAVGGSYPKGNGKWGQADLAGSVAEWVFDSAVYPGPSGVDPADTKDTLSRYSRGGDYSSAPQLEMISASEHQRFALDRIALGFRCARDL